MKKIVRSPITFFILLTSLFFAGCEEGAVELNPEQNTSEFSKDTVYYNWGELSINRKEEYDVISYLKANGKLKSVDTYITSDNLKNTVEFTYVGNSIKLNTIYKDEYQLDNKGRVISHTSEETQQSTIYVNTQRFYYTVDGYLQKETFELSIKGNTPRIITYIDYVIKDGRFISYTLKTSSDEKVTREYQFNCDNQAVELPASLFVPVLANNTFTSVEKYLNFGKPSTHALKSIDYKIIDNYTGVYNIGTFKVQNTIVNGKLLEFKLLGDIISGFPADNLSPLPREIKYAPAN